MDIKQLWKSKKGFTLVELLIVIIIISILTGMMMFAVSAAKDKAEQTAAEVAVNTVKRAMELGFAGADMTGVRSIIINSSAVPVHNKNETIIVNNILEYLKGSNMNEVSLYVYGFDPPQYYINYYPHGDRSSRLYYQYDSHNPEAGVQKIKY